MRRDVAFPASSVPSSFISIYLQNSCMQVLHTVIFPKILSRASTSLKFTHGAVVGLLVRSVRRQQVGVRPTHMQAICSRPHLDHSSVQWRCAEMCTRSLSSTGWCANISLRADFQRWRRVPRLWDSRTEDAFRGRFGRVGSMYAGT